VVAADGDLVRVWKASEPVDVGLDLARGAIVAEVTGVDEQVSIRYVGPF
jgi:hypothetical protein